MRQQQAHWAAELAEILADRLGERPDNLEVRAIAAAVAAAVWVAAEEWQAQDGRAELGALIDQALGTVLGRAALAGHDDPAASDERGPRPRLTHDHRATSHPSAERRPALCGTKSPCRPTSSSGLRSRKRHQQKVVMPGLALPWLGGVMNLSADRPTPPSAPPGHPTLREAVRAPRRRRPTGEPPPLPYHLQTSGVGWLIAAGVLIVLSIWVFFAEGLRGPAIAVTVVDDAIVGWLAGSQPPGLVGIMRGLAALSSWWVLNRLALGLLLALLALRRLRQLIVSFTLAYLVITTATVVGASVRRPRPFGVVIQTGWGGWALPSQQVMFLAALLVGILYTLVPEGRWRNTGKWVAAGLITLTAVGRVALGADAPTDVLVGAAIGVTLPLVAFRCFTPNEVFPVSYRRGRAAHLDVAGPRGEAIRRGLEDQLGRSRWPRSDRSACPDRPVPPRCGSPSRATHPGYLFGKLYARSHLRADRWYKLGRELLYGRLEDEKPFNTVRRLVQQEDYALRLCRGAGLPSPDPWRCRADPRAGIPAGVGVLRRRGGAGRGRGRHQVIDDGLRIIRKLWEAGLAHRDIKPANLLVRDGRLLLIDVAFVEARPSPWRQAVDLANMMLCLALRSSPELVFQRALSQFNVEEIAEGFAAARGLALPSQLRRMLRAQGRDLHAAFVRLLPAPPQPIPIQRWSARRVGLLGWWRRWRWPSARRSSPGRSTTTWLSRPRWGSAAGPQPRLRPPGAVVADGPVGALGVTGALRRVPTARLDGRERGGQRRPLGHHPGPRPRRHRRGRHAHGGRLRPGRRRREDASSGARSAPVCAGGAPTRRVLRDLVRPVPGRLRDLPAALHRRPNGPVRQRGAAGAGVHHPRAAAPGAQPALRWAAADGSPGHTMNRPGVLRSLGPGQTKVI